MSRLLENRGAQAGRENDCAIGGASTRQGLHGITTTTRHAASGSRDGLCTVFI